MSIILRSLEKNFQVDHNSFQVLKNINLEIKSGEFVSIVGKSGSGKSTFLNMITGIDHPSKGYVLVNGVNLNKLKRSELSRWRGINLGIVFQFFQLIPTLTLVENVTLPMDFCKMYKKSERKKIAMLLLEKVGLKEHATKLPSQVSGGQQQRAAIARALANNPPIIVADEPTGSLDSNTAQSVFELFKELIKEGKTVIFVTHDEHLANESKRKIILSDGKIINDNYMLKDNVN
ncbi:MAG TPA: ABC transporter ATP-binding protein [Pseudoneobacillus sp.]|nr:ABC transporter ATP-binding protein [Pseudoneobacillus sp.]